MTIFFVFVQNKYLFLSNLLALSYHLENRDYLESFIQTPNFERMFFPLEFHIFPDKYLVPYFQIIYYIVHHQAFQLYSKPDFLRCCFLGICFQLMNQNFPELENTGFDILFILILKFNIFNQDNSMEDIQQYLVKFSSDIQLQLYCLALQQASEFQTIIQIISYLIPGSKHHSNNFSNLFHFLKIRFSEIIMQPSYIIPDLIAIFHFHFPHVKDLDLIDEFAHFFYQNIYLLHRFNNSPKITHFYFCLAVHYPPFLEAYHGPIFEETDFIKMNKSHECFSPKSRGIQNYSVTCYFNSVIQQLFGIAEFRQMIIGADHFNIPILREFQDLFKQLNEEESVSLNPINFLKNL
jgi:hypothetical protein